ncbi:phosphoglycolate phosphatase [Aliiroseovarius subalbicans]|uniref:phosphoglycolate phosphatase n=1 Tax=Aliiroseovarius subalbicans TaxID=2925840 RepID=UPI001F5797EC|nr:phosphoglycolate phosphatase [Aliiroseovarius subalbicans]MCI2399883.1 phosphoglycolate phosphatase [Aliiroseovarius subalbicans]
MRIVFDLDGTLIDSAPDLQAATNRMLADQGCASLDLATITSFVGNGLPKLVERAMRASGLDMTEHPRLSALTLEYYNQDPATLSQLYPGLKALLTALKAAGHRLGVCTNKPFEPAVAILVEMGLEDHFDVVVGGDTLAVKKPDPQPLLHSLVKLGDGPALYVGDSEVDAETAARAGVDFALFTEGYRKTPIEDLPHAFAFDHFDKLAAHLA